MWRHEMRCWIAGAVLGVMGLSGCMPLSSGDRPVLGAAAVKDCEADLRGLPAPTTATRSTVRFPAAACSSDIVDLGSEASVDAKNDQIQRRIRAAMAPIERRNLEINRRMLAKYPRCGTVDMKSMRGKFETQLHSFDAERRPIAEGTGCVVVPQPGPPESAEGLELHLKMMAAIAEAELNAMLQLKVRQVQPHVNGVVVGGIPWELRPFYRAILDEAAGGLAPVAARVGAVSGSDQPRARIAIAADLVQRLDSLPLALNGSVRSAGLASPAAVLAERRGTADAKAIAMAAIVRALAPDVDLLLLEIGSGFLLGVAIEPVDGDLTFADEGDRTRRSPQSYVLVDPWAPTPLGRTVQPSLAPVLADGVLSWTEIDVIYDLRPLAHPVAPTKWIGRG